MSVTEFRRKSRKKLFFMGMLVTAVPLVLLVMVVWAGLHSYKEENRILEEKLSKEGHMTGYVLTEDVSAGQPVTSGMLKKIWITGDRRTNVLKTAGEEITGKRARDNFAKGTVMNAQCVYEEDETSDMRMKSFDFMELNPVIQQGDYVDIRITYPNGEDYIVVGHKELLAVEQEQAQTQELQQNPKITMRVTEEEILRLASAYVDTVCYDSAKIYAVAYLDEFQQPGTVDYPVNPDVFQLLGWNPNVTGYQPSEEECQYRDRLEENLSAFGTSKNKVSYEHLQEPVLQ